MKIYCYVYEADYHCAECAKRTFGINDFGLSEGEDKENNPISALYCHENIEFNQMCGTCRKELE